MDITLKQTPMHMWVTHPTEVRTWSQVTKLHWEIFMLEEADLIVWFQDMEDPKAHLTLYTEWWV